MTSQITPTEQLEEARRDAWSMKTSALARFDNVTLEANCISIENTESISDGLAEISRRSENRYEDLSRLRRTTSGAEANLVSYLDKNIESIDSINEIRALVEQVRQARNEESAAQKNQVNLAREFRNNLIADQERFFREQFRLEVSEPFRDSLVGPQSVDYVGQPILRAEPLVRTLVRRTSSHYNINLDDDQVSQFILDYPMPVYGSKYTDLQNAVQTIGSGLLVGVGFSEEMATPTMVIVGGGASFLFWLGKPFVVTTHSAVHAKYQRWLDRKLKDDDDAAAD